MKASGIAYLAHEALRRVARPDHMIEELIQASLSNELGALSALAQSFLSEGVSHRDIVFGLIPKALERLGDDWMTDRRSWVDVSIASTRLQGYVQYADVLSSDAPARQARVLILVPKGEDHTIGAAILQKRINAAGHLAELVIGATADTLIHDFALSSFDLFAISSQRPENLAEVQDLLTGLKNAAPGTARILGGYISAYELPDHLPADLITNDLAEAFAHIGVPLEAGTVSSITHTKDNR